MGDRRLSRGRCISPEHTLFLHAPYFDVALLRRSKVESVRTDSESSDGTRGRVVGVRICIFCGVIRSVDRGDVMRMRCNEEILSARMPDCTSVVGEFRGFSVGNSGNDVIDDFFSSGSGRGCIPNDEFTI